MSVGLMRLLHRGPTLVAAICLLSACGGTALSIPRPMDELLPAPAPPALEPSLLSFLVDLPLSLLLEAAEGAFLGEVARERAWVEAPRGLGPVGLQFQYRLWGCDPPSQSGARCNQRHLFTQDADLTILLDGSLPIWSTVGRLLLAAFDPRVYSAGQDRPPRRMGVQPFIPTSF